MWHLSVPTNS